MRYEFKYYVPNFKLKELRDMLRPFVHPDKFAARQPDNQYTVRSIYFDSPGFEMYHSKLQHLAHRMKVRLRAYNLQSEDSPTFFEIKRKYEAPIVKNRATLPYSAVKAIFAGASLEDYLPVTNKADNVRRFFYQIHSRHLSPVVNVIYEREVYLSNVPDPENDLRITFDKNLRSVPFPGVNELFIERDMRFPLQDQFILEVKFNRFCPVWLKPMLSQMQLHREPASKYVMCIEAQNQIQTSKKYSAFYQLNRAPGLSKY